MYSKAGLIIRLRKDIVGSTPTRPTKPGLGLRVLSLKVVAGLFAEKAVFCGTDFPTDDPVSLAPPAFAVKLAADCISALQWCPNCNIGVPNKRPLCPWAAIHVPCSKGCSSGNGPVALHARPMFAKYMAMCLRRLITR